MIFKIRHVLAGGHVHCSLFAAPAENQTFAKCGDFCIRREEFGPMREAMPGVVFEPMVTTPPPKPAGPTPWSRP